MYRLVIANKTSGQIHDITNSTAEITLTTQRKAAAGQLTFTWYKTGETVSFFEGDVVRLEDDGQVVFYGWVFTKQKNRWNKFEVTCYDRLRYLKAKGSYAFYGQTASEIISAIAKDLQLDVSNLPDTGYKIPSFIKTNQACIDIMQDALDQTLLNTGKVYVLYDDGEGLALRASDEWVSEYVIGDKSYMTNYAYKTDIDESTANYIKLVQPDQQTGRTQAVVAQDDYTIGRWGLLQEYRVINGTYNTAQLTEMAQQILANNNRRKRSFAAEAVGVPGLRAGQLLRVVVSNMGDIDLNQYVLLETVSHSYQNDVHMMSFSTLEV